MFVLIAINVFNLVLFVRGSGDYYGPYGEIIASVIGIR